MGRKVAIAVVTLIVAVGIAVGGWAYGRWQKLETEWSAVSAKTSDAERAAACDQFLAAFPESHLFGNPRATEAKALAAEARARLADEARRKESARLAAEAEAQAEARAAAAALPVRERLLAALRDRLFDVLADALDIGRGAVVLHLENHGVHEYAYGVVELGPAPTREGLRLLDPATVEEVLGQKIYDAKTRTVDKEALRLFLDASFVAPGEPVLGATAQLIYPAFRRRVRNELRLYRGVVGLPLSELKAEFLKLSPARPDSERDWRELYRFLFEKTDSLRAFGIAPCELRAPDLGFWVRRVEDGTAPMLGRFLEKLVAAYDGEWLLALGDKPAPFTATSGWAGADPAQLVKKGASWVIEVGGESVDPCTRDFRADPREKPAAAIFDDATTGDRFVRKDALGVAWAAAVNGVEAFTTDGKQLVVTGDDRIFWVDVGTMQEVRSQPIAHGTGVRPRLVAGRGAIIRPVTEGSTEVLDAASGGVLAKFNNFVAADFDDGATVMAALASGKGDEPGRLDVRYRSGEWIATAIALPAGYDEVKVHPSGEVVFARQGSGDKAGFKAWDIGSGDRRPELDMPGVSRFSLSPGGNRLCRPDEAKGEVLLEWLDVAEGHRAPEPKKRWPGKDCRWLTNDRVLIQREPNGIHTVLEVVDSATGKTIGRRIRVPNWDLRNSFKDLSPDGRFLLLENGQKSLLLWSLGAGKPPAPPSGDEP